MSATNGGCVIVTSNDFLKFSERVGKSRLLIQGAGGNLSVKENGVLWIKASGCWLQDANNKNIFVPVNHENNANANANANANLTNSSTSISKFERIPMDFVNDELRPSIETSLHALMPHKYVIHTHSVNAIALSVSESGEKKMSEALDGLNWGWIPYAKPGVPLAKEIQKVIHSRPDILILTNHGVVLGADSVAQLSELLDDFEARVETKARAVRTPNSIDIELPGEMSFEWSNNPVVNSMAFDNLSITLSQGVLYPDHVVFLGPLGSLVIDSISDADNEKYYIVRNQGVLVSKTISENAIQMIECMANVILRIPSQEKISYLSSNDIDSLIDWDAEKFRQKFQK